MIKAEVRDMAGMMWYGSNAANNEKGLPRSILMIPQIYRHNTAEL